MFKKASERAETALKKNASNARILEKLGQERANLHWQLGLNSQHISAENAAKIADTISFQYLTMSPCHHVTIIFSHLNQLHLRRTSYESHGHFTASVQR